MKTLEELDISPMPWRLRNDGEFGLAIVAPCGSSTVVVAECGRNPNVRFLLAAPKMYEKLRQSTNEIEFVIQFVKNRYVKAALRELAEENKAVLAGAAG